MIKKLILVLGLVLILAVPGMAQVDSTKLFVYGTGFGALPTDDDGTYDISGGFQVKTQYRIFDHVSLGVTYQDVNLRGEKLHKDASAEYKAGQLTIWALEVGSPFNLGFIVEGGQSTIVNGEGITNSMGMASGMVITKSVYKTIHMALFMEYAKLGDKEDCFLISLGMGAPISFK